MEEQGSDIFCGLGEGLDGDDDTMIDMEDKTNYGFGGDDDGDCDAPLDSVKTVSMVSAQYVFQITTKTICEFTGAQGVLVSFLRVCSFRAKSGSKTCAMALRGKMTSQVGHIRATLVLQNMFSLHGWNKPFQDSDNNIFHLWRVSALIAVWGASPNHGQVIMPLALCVIPIF
jgi:hypothetical protein